MSLINVNGLTSGAAGELEDGAEEGVRAVLESLINVSSRVGFGGGASGATGELEDGAEEGVRAVLDVVHRRELLLAVAAPVPGRHEDHPRRADRRHVLGVVARARQDVAVPGASSLRRALDRGDHV